MRSPWPPFTAHETRTFGAECGFEVCNRPSYSPESNGMTEAFVKTFKRDYVYLADLPDTETALKLVPRTTTSIIATRASRCSPRGNFAAHKSN